MARKRKGLPLSGWINLDKPLGLTSQQAVSAVRRITGAAKAGHGGTLDPLASGILPVALGEATKTVSYVMDGAKTYRFTLSFGEARSTDDREGEVTETSAVRPTPDQIVAALPGFVGDIEQTPPAFSAIKIGGERAYDLARAGEAVELQSRTVHVARFELLGMPDADHAEFEVDCGKGTYIRSLGRDLARLLGTVGHISALRRTACGPFREENAISLEKLQEFGHSPAPRTYLLAVETALDDIPALALTQAEARRLRSGCPVHLHGNDRGTLPPIDPGTTVRAMDGGRMVALARIDNGEIRPVRVLNLTEDDKEFDDVDHA